MAAALKASVSFGLFRDLARSLCHLHWTQVFDVRFLHDWYRVTDLSFWARGGCRLIASGRTSGRFTKGSIQELVSGIID